MSTVLAPAPAEHVSRAGLRFPELQGQRGLAALAILVLHVYQYDRSGPDARSLAFAAAVVGGGALGRPQGPWHRVSSFGVLPWIGLVSCSLRLVEHPTSTLRVFLTPVPDRSLLVERRRSR